VFTLNPKPRQAGEELDSLLMEHGLAADLKNGGAASEAAKAALAKALAAKKAARSGSAAEAAAKKWTKRYERRFDLEDEDNEDREFDDQVGLRMAGVDRRERAPEEEKVFAPRSAQGASWLECLLVVCAGATNLHCLQRMESWSLCLPVPPFTNLALACLRHASPPGYPSVRSICHPADAQLLGLRQISDMAAVDSSLAAEAAVRRPPDGQSRSGGASASADAEGGRVATADAGGDDILTQLLGDGQGSFEEQLEAAASHMKPDDFTNLMELPTGVGHRGGCVEGRGFRV
jgi:hypothetical protein